MVYHPIISFLAHLVTHSTFMPLHSCWWSGGFCGGLKFISSIPSFPAMSIYPGTHNTSMLALLFLSRKSVVVSTNFWDICWLDPGFSFIIEATRGVLSANSIILDCFLFSSGIASWNSIAVSSLNSTSILASHTSAFFPIPLLLLLPSVPFQYSTHPAPIQLSFSFSFIDLTVYVRM